MTIRDVLWTAEAQAEARKLSAQVRRQLRDRLAALATGPIPPHDVLPDLDIPNAYHVHTPSFTMIVGVYDDVDEIRVWVVRANS